MLMIAVPAVSQAATHVVTMGLPTAAQKTFNQKLSSDVNDFFPHGITIRAGDSIRFVPTGFHTVDLPPRGNGPLALITPNGQKVSGALDAAGAPFWFNGQDQVGFNPALATAPGFGKRFTYTGANRVESGLPLQSRPRPMTVKFTRTGRYTYDCDVHPGMKGVVRVVGRHAKVPTARANARAVAAQLKRDTAIAKSLARTRVPAGFVDVGSAGPHGVEFFGFFPRTLTIPTGTTVRFRMSAKSFDDHTATTGPGDPETDPSSYLGQLAASFEAPAINPAAIYPSDPPGAPAGLTPTSHGNGFWNSGVMDTSAASPLPSSNAVTFTTPGTYQFFCLIHPFMHGTVVVR
jgi:plastocyanin